MVLKGLVVYIYVWKKNDLYFSFRHCSSPKRFLISILYIFWINCNDETKKYKSHLNGCKNGEILKSNGKHRVWKTTLVQQITAHERTREHVYDRTRGRGFHRNKTFVRILIRERDQWKFFSWNNSILNVCHSKWIQVTQNCVNMWIHWWWVTLSL